MTKQLENNINNILHIIYMNVFSFIYSAMSLSTKIKNINYPLCKTCIHFLPYRYCQNPYEFAKCKFFGEKNVITGEIEYEYAESCRKSEYKCNITGNYYKSAK
jgi:hypothetical protein